MKKNHIAVLLAAVLAAAAVTGCGGAGTAGGTGSQSSQEAVLDEAEDAGEQAESAGAQSSQEENLALGTGSAEAPVESAGAQSSQEENLALGTGSAEAPEESAGAQSSQEENLALGTGSAEETVSGIGLGSSSPVQEGAGTQKSVLSDAAGQEPDGGEAPSDDADGPQEDTGNGSGPGSTEPAEPDSGTAAKTGEIPVGSSLTDVSYVLIYDPLIYDEYDPNQIQRNTSLETGDLASQIVTGMARADDMMDPADMPVLLSQGQINKDLDPEAMIRDGDKAMGMDPVYSKGDRHQFYSFAGDLTLQKRELSEFECVYEGETCCVWSWNDSVSEAEAEELGTEFDSTIYQADVDAFGQGRFTQDGGKVNILMYPMQAQLGGFFSMADIFAEGELPDDYAEILRPNYGHAIININSDHLKENLSYVKSTLAHEFQHLICASEYFYSDQTPMMRTWLNEAMSAYAEEMVYPGIKEEGMYNQMMYLSDFYRKGQSLYNFGTEGDDYIGAYGAVYLFSQYLSQRAGDDVFSKVHTYWRTKGDASMDEAGALVSAAGTDFYEEIDQSRTYPAQVSRAFSSPEEEWMSKLTLAFYMETLSGKLAGLEEYEDALHAATLYSEIDPQQIEGGGRMLVQTENNSFEVPENADSGMLYIGLDADFIPIPEKVIVGK